MAQAKLVHEGNQIDYTPGAAVAAGDVVVQGELVGVANLDIGANKLGALAVSGVFAFTKTAGASTAIAVGALVYWDDTGNVATETATANKLIGKCVAAAGDNDTTVRVRLDQ